MRILLLLTFSFISLIACNPDKKRKSDPDKIKFTTSDASELFFRNIRQLYYDKATMKEAKLDIYRIKDRDRAEDQPVINLSIVINWRYDEAYILLEPNAYLQEYDTLKIHWQDTVSRQKGNYFFHAAGSKEDQFRFASKIYQSLQDEHNLYLIEQDNQKTPLLKDRQAREAFRKTIFDYFRLVDLL